MSTDSHVELEGKENSDVLPTSTLTEQWLHRLTNDSIDAAVTYSATLTTEQTDRLAEIVMAAATYTAPASNWNQFLLAIAQAPQLSAKALIDVASCIRSEAPLAAEAITAVVRASAFCEDAAAQIVLWTDGPLDVVFTLLARAGSLYPTAYQLAAGPQHPDNTQHRANVQTLLKVLTSDLTHATPATRHTVAQLGCTWTGTYPELLETARGITA